MTPSVFDGNYDNPAPTPKPKTKEKRPKGQGHELHFRNVDPWPEPVDGPGLLDWIAEVFLRFLALPDGAVEALALWTVHTHAHDCFEVSPLLVLRSPAMRCGKTSTLRLLARLVPRPLSSSNITGPALFRTVEKYKPTLLIDEADSFARENEELRGILNSGHERENATIVRLEGKGFEPRAFSAWCPKAIASIGALAATLEDRAVTVAMRRKAKDELVERMRVDRLYSLGIVKCKIARWAEDNAETLREADPKVPDILDDRAADNWRPLLAIADTAGGEWPGRARAAAVLLSVGRVEEAGPKVELLTDIATVWEARDVDRLPSEDMVAALCDMKDRPWAEWNRGRPLSPSGLARHLKSFEIGPKDIRFADGNRKGYHRADFSDAFARYVSRSKNASVAALSRVENGQLSAPGLECHGVADGNPLEPNGDAYEGPEVGS